MSVFVSRCDCYLRLDRCPWPPDQCEADKARWARLGRPVEYDAARFAQLIEEDRVKYPHSYPKRARSTLLAPLMTLVLSALTAVTACGMIWNAWTMRDRTEVIDTTLGQLWSPLSEGESKALTAAVAPLTKRPLRVLYADENARLLGESLAEAFGRAGWNQKLVIQGSTLGTGVSTGRGSGMALTLAKAIEQATRFKQVHIYGLEENDNPDDVFVGVGVRRAGYP